MAYESTTVPVEKSQAEVRGLLARHGADRFAFGEDRDGDGVSWAAVSFTFSGRAVRIKVPHKQPDPKVLSDKAWRARSKTRADIEREMVEQEARRIWRVMAWNLKARLVAVEEGVETFEEAFLAHLINERTGMTVYEELSGSGSIELGQPLLALTAGSS